MLGCIYYTLQGRASVHIVALRSIGFYGMLACELRLGYHAT